MAPVSRIAYMDGRAYGMYRAGFGDDGSRMPVYLRGACVAEVRKPSMVRDRLHAFDILLIDGMDALAVICLCCLAYLSTYYEPWRRERPCEARRAWETRSDALRDKCRNAFEGVPMPRSGGS